MEPRRSLTSPLVTVGLHSAGKTTLANALAAELNAPICELGSGVREAAHARGSSNLVETAHELLGAEPLRLAISAVRRAGPHVQRTIFVGPRTAAEFDYLQCVLDRPLTVGLATPEHLRNRHWRRRHLSIDDTWEQREWHETVWGTANLIYACRLVIDGTWRIDRQCDTVLAELLKPAVLT